jgi:hypothetical protein
MVFNPDFLKENIVVVQFGETKLPAEVYFEDNLAKKRSAVSLGHSKKLRLGSFYQMSLNLQPNCCCNSLAFSKPVL